MARVEETGWLIEQQVGRELYYWCGSCWSRDHDKAIRFAREIDANRMLASLGSGHGRVVEHMWVDIQCLDEPRREALPESGLPRPEHLLPDTVSTGSTPS